MARLLAPTGDYRTAPNAIRLAWLAQLATQLADLHDTGAVHGDVRPARVRLLPLTYAKDFPSVELGPAATLADAAQVLYMHPRLLDGSITVPTRDTDVYALGVTAWHMLSGTTPFAAAFPDGVVAYDGATAKALLSAYLARVPDGQALPASPMLWYEQEATDLHRLWSARDRGGVTARSLAASLLWLARCADRADGGRSIGWVPGRAMSLIVAVRDTAMARVRSCVVAVEADYTILMVKREVERVTGYLVEEQRMSRPDGAKLDDDDTVGDAGLRCAGAVTATVGRKYCIRVILQWRFDMEDEVIELEVAGGEMVDAAVLRPIADRFGAAPGTRLSAYRNNHGCMLRDPATTTMRQHAIRPGSRIVVLGPADRELPGPITILVKDASGETLMFKVRPTTKMVKILQTYASKRGVSPESIRFIVGGERVKDDSTAGGLDLQDGGVVHVMLEQTGD